MRRRLIAFSLSLLSIARSRLAAAVAAAARTRVSIKTMQLAADNTAPAESMGFTVDTSGDLGGKQFTGHATGVTSGDGKFVTDHVHDRRRAESEVRTVDGVMYMKFGGDLFGSVAPEGKPWVRIDFGAAARSRRSANAEPEYCPRAVLRVSYRV